MEGSYSAFPDQCTQKRVARGLDARICRCASGGLFYGSLVVAAPRDGPRARSSEIVAGGRTPASDSLRFANGLLRQKKFDLAAQEYERILKGGATGSERDDARFGLGNAWLSPGPVSRGPRGVRRFLEGRAR